MNTSFYDDDVFRLYRIRSYVEETGQLVPLDLAEAIADDFGVVIPVDLIDNECLISDMDEDDLVCKILDYEYSKKGKK